MPESLPSSLFGSDYESRSAMNRSALAIITLTTV